MLTKFCNGCKKILPLAEFHERMCRGKKRPRTKCKKCFILTITKIQKEKLQEMRVLLGSKCHRCGYDRCQAALEFHHLRDKEHEISRMVRGSSISKILKEVEKCILICANCHRELHAGVRSTPSPFTLGGGTKAVK